MAHMLIDVLLYLATGAAAGLLAGLLGIGGGLIIVAALAWILPELGFPAAHVMHVALATALASIVFTSLSSAAAHWRRGSVIVPSLWRLAPGLLAGGAIGAWIATLLSAEALRYCVAGFCLFAAWRMAFGGTRARAGEDATPRSPWLAAWGVAIGAISAVVGIGGGSLTVPLLVWYGARPVRAVGTSAACGFAIAVASALGYVVGGEKAATELPPGSLGYVYLPAVAGIALTSVMLAPAGARLAHALSAASLKRVFAAFLLVMGFAVLAAG